MPKVPQAAFPETSLCGLSDVHKCSGGHGSADTCKEATWLETIRQLASCIYLTHILEHLKPKGASAKTTYLAVFQHAWRYLGPFKTMI